MKIKLFFSFFLFFFIYQIGYHHYCDNNLDKCFNFDKQKNNLQTELKYGSNVNLTEFSKYINKDLLLKKYFNIINPKEEDRIIIENLDDNLLYFAAKDKEGGYWLFDFSYYYYLDDESIKYFDLSPKEMDKYYFLYLKNWDTFKNKVIFVEKTKINKHRITVSWLNSLSKYFRTDYQFDKKEYNERIKLLKQIYKTTIKITEGLKTNDEKISAIYKWINNNIIYDESLYNDIVYTNNYKIKAEDISEKDVSHSWIMTYQNKKGVCDWISKLFVYMLMFSWIKDIQLENWYELHSGIAHSWIKIWENYFDPTFDLSNKSNKIFQYYKLPKDLFYADRITDSSFIKNFTQDERNEILINNYFNLVSKYWNSNYPVLSPYIILKNNNINKTKDFTFEDLKIISKNFIELNSLNDVETFLTPWKESYYSKIWLENISYFIFTYWINSTLQDRTLYYAKKENIYFFVEEK